MEGVNAKALKRMAALLGYDWSDDELERLLPVLEKSMEAVQRLDEVALRDVEPSVHYRMP